MIDGLYEKKIFNEKLKDIEDDCPGCKDSSKMYSTGNLYKSKLDYWVMEFICTKDGENIKKWNIKFEPLIQEVLKDEGIE